MNISGTVVKGDGYGRKLGFPTANLETKDPLPPAGVYAGSATLENKNYRAGILINPNGKVEAHMIGFDGDAYGKQVTLMTEKFLREYKKFDTEAELITQITKDIQQC
ncbi:MAG: riboflavin kinase [Patescibacteria group bacterium]